LGGSASTDTFKQWVYETLLPGLSEEVKSHVLKPGLTLADVTAAVANYYGTTECTLRQIIKEPDKRNEGRKVAMYLYQEILDERLSSIASYFNLGHSSSVSFITDEIRTLRLNYETFSKKVEVIIKRSMKQVIYPPLFSLSFSLSFLTLYPLSFIVRQHHMVPSLHYQRLGHHRCLSTRCYRMGRHHYHLIHRHCRSLHHQYFHRFIHNECYQT
jgi:hypothetical protein